MIRTSGHGVHWISRLTLYQLSYHVPANCYKYDSGTGGNFCCFPWALQRTVWATRNHTNRYTTAALAGTSVAFRGRCSRQFGQPATTPTAISDSGTGGNFCCFPWAMQRTVWATRNHTNRYKYDSGTGQNFCCFPWALQQTVWATRNHTNRYTTAALAGTGSWGDGVVQLTERRIYLFIH